MPCYTSSTSLPAADLDDSSGVIYNAIVASGTSITFTFTPPNGESITSVQCSPTGPTVGTNNIVFTIDHVNIPYLVTVIYTGPSGTFRDKDDDGHIHPLETPTKKPTFKPVLSCP